VVQTIADDTGLEISHQVNNDTRKRKIRDSYCLEALIQVNSKEFFEKFRQRGSGDASKFRIPKFYNTKVLVKRVIVEPREERPVNFVLEMRK
jgi:hypothetical protein